jgi:hypothetical protein
MSPIANEAKAGNANCVRRLSTVDHLIKVACCVKKVYDIFNTKGAYLYQLVQGGQPC